MSRLPATLALLGPAALPEAAAAASEGMGGFFWELGNLTLLGVVLYFAARKPVSAYLANRRAGIAGELEAAEKQLKDAEERLAEWTRREDGLDEEIAEIRRAAHAAAERESAGLTEDARAAAERIRTSAHAAMDGELRRAHTELRQETADLAVKLADELLRRQVDDADQDRLVDEFVARLERGEAA